MNNIPVRFLYLIVFATIINYPSFSQIKKMSPRDRKLYEVALTDIDAFAKEVTKNDKSNLERAKTIVHWLTKNFNWETTDYQKRSVKQIIERRGGNCNDLAMVAIEAMKKLNIKMRRVHEVHIRTISADRDQRAKTLINEKGKGYSIFGRHHNDHIYLELYDPLSNNWFPADPWSGVVGVDEWLKARVWFGSRSSPNPDAPDMIVPFAIFAEDEKNNFTIERSGHYLFDEFDKMYGGRLHKLPEWQQWCNLINLLNPQVAGAFAGKINLHDYESEIDQIAKVYESIRKSISKIKN